MLYQEDKLFDQDELKKQVEEMVPLYKDHLLKLEQYMRDELGSHENYEKFMEFHGWNEQQYNPNVTINKDNIKIFAQKFRWGEVLDLNYDFSISQDQINQLQQIINNNQMYNNLQQYLTSIYPFDFQKFPETSIVDLQREKSFMVLRFLLQKNPLVINMDSEDLINLFQQCGEQPALNEQGLLKFVTNMFQNVSKLKKVFYDNTVQNWENYNGQFRQLDIVNRVSNIINNQQYQIKIILKKSDRFSDSSLAESLKNHQFNYNDTRNSFNDLRNKFKQGISKKVIGDIKKGIFDQDLYKNSDQPQRVKILVNYLNWPLWIDECIEKLQKLRNQVNKLLQKQDNNNSLQNSQLHMIEYFNISLTQMMQKRREFVQSKLQKLKFDLNLQLQFQRQVNLWEIDEFNEFTLYTPNQAIFVPNSVIYQPQSGQYIYITREAPYVNEDIEHFLTKYNFNLSQKVYLDYSEQLIKQLEIQNTCSQIQQQNSQNNSQGLVDSQTIQNNIDVNFMIYFYNLYAPSNSNTAIVDDSGFQTFKIQDFDRKQLQNFVNNQLSQKKQ